MVPGKDTRVVREKAVDETDEKNLQLVTVVPASEQRIVKLAHFLCDLDIDRVFILVGPFRIAGHEAEPVDLRREVGQEKIRLRVCLQIIEAEVGEVGNEDVFGKLLLGYAGEIVQGLLIGPIEILAAGFMLCLLYTSDAADE